MEMPNAETLAAMAEVEEMKKHPEKYKKYDSFQELLQEVTGTEKTTAAVDALKK